MSSERKAPGPDCEANSGPKSVPKSPGKLAQAVARDRRLAEQLRTNLKRRKAQGRTRDDGGSER